MTDIVSGGALNSILTRCLRHETLTKLTSSPAAAASVDGRMIARWSSLTADDDD